MSKIFTRKAFHGRKGDTMNATVDKWTVDAARYFKEEVLDIMPDIPREELSDMVGEYIYYQQAEVGKDAAHKVVEETCLRK
jgi:4-aminobutyrate aminotransferase-like enzyme